jgi:hypothetical protein
MALVAGGSVVELSLASWWKHRHIEFQVIEEKVQSDGQKEVSTMPKMVGKMQQSATVKENWWVAACEHFSGLIGD